MLNNKYLKYKKKYLELKKKGGGICIQKTEQIPQNLVYNSPTNKYQQVIKPGNIPSNTDQVYLTFLKEDISDIDLKNINNLGFSKIYEDADKYFNIQNVNVKKNIIGDTFKEQSVGIFKMDDNTKIKLLGLKKMSMEIDTLINMNT